MTSGKRRIPKTPTKKTIDLIPFPTHWVSVADNHIPLDSWLLLEVIDVEGNLIWTLGYKSSKTGTWIDGGNGAIEEEYSVTHYSVLTDKHGKTKRAPY